jgi:hypothetical protein
MELEGLLSSLQAPTNEPYSGQLNPVHTLSPIFWRFIHCPPSEAIILINYGVLRTNMYT